MLSQTGWRHKFHIITRSYPRRTPLPSLSRITSSLFSELSLIAYIFGLVEERWYRCRHQFTTAVEYQGFLIGLTPSGKLVCCLMDSHGDPDELTPSRVLHDMFDICMLREFCYFDAYRGFMGLYKDGEDNYIWLVYTLQGLDADVHVHMHLMAKAELCVVTDRGVYRLPLDIGKLRNKEKIPPKLYVPPHVEFEKLEVDIHDTSMFSRPTVDFCSPDGEIPYYFMHPVVVEDHLLLIGGWVPSLSFNPNIDVAYGIAYDRLIPIPSPLRVYSNPDLCSWLTTQSKRDVFFYRFRSSNYVLDATDPQKLSFHKLRLFFSGCAQEVLPNPPDDIRVLSQTGWGHKFHIITRPNHCLTTSPSLSSTDPSLHTALLSELSPVAYTFDLVEERWHRCCHQFTAAVEYQGFFIGLTPSEKLVCCPMDSHEDPDELTPSRVLHDMFDICMLRRFHSFDADPIFMCLYKDGDVDYIWLVYTLQGLDADIHVHMPFVLFQVFIQGSISYAHLTATQVSQFMR